MSAGMGDRRKMSDRRDETLATGECGAAWIPKARMQDVYVRKVRDGGLVRVRIDLHSAHAVSEFVTCPAPTANGSASSPSADLAAASFALAGSNNAFSNCSAGLYSMFPVPVPFACERDIFICKCQDKSCDPTWSELAVTMVHFGFVALLFLSEDNQPSRNCPDICKFGMLFRMSYCTYVMEIFAFVDVGAFSS
jgi:hypothetical protein